MADPRFFNNHGPFKLSVLAEQIGAELSGGDFEVLDVAALDVARAGELSFFDNVKYKAQFEATKAAAVICHPDAAKFAPDGVSLLLSQSPYKSYALAAQAFYPNKTPAPFISEQAHIWHKTKIPDSCVIHANVTIEGGVELGEHVVIEPGAVIKQNTIIGEHSYIGANAVISHAVIGAHVRIYRGACIGQDGFGFAPDPEGFVKVPQLGRVIIEDHAEIGANTCVDRGAGPDTVIGQGTWIDNLVQIGHNVKVGKGCVIVSQVGISGSTVLEDFVMIGGQGGLAGHLHIGMGAKIAAQSGVMRDIPAGEEHMGSPSMPIKQYMRQVAALKRLITPKKKA